MGHSNGQVANGLTSQHPTKGSKEKEKMMRKEGWLLPLSIVGLTALCLWAADTIFDEQIRGWKFLRWEGLHNPTIPAVAVTLYLAMVFFLPRFMKNRAPLELKTPMLVHNYFLSFLSLLMLVAMARESFQIGLLSGWEGLCCDSEVYHPKTKIYFWYYVFYLSKMYEFIDTLILILRKKPLIFLHVYHHVITLWLCWYTMDTYLSMQWLCSIANALVHVFMYYFYACQALQINIWWKKYLTSLQIIQFIMDEIGNASWAYYTVIEGKKCSGTWGSFWFGMLVIGSFLALFIQFFKKTYKGKAE